MLRPKKAVQDQSPWSKGRGVLSAYVDAATGVAGGARRKRHEDARKSAPAQFFQTAPGLKMVFGQSMSG